MDRNIRQIGGAWGDTHIALMRVWGRVWQCGQTEAWWEFVEDGGGWGCCGTSAASCCFIAGYRWSVALTAPILPVKSGLLRHISCFLGQNCFVLIKPFSITKLYHYINQSTNESLSWQTHLCYHGLSVCSLPRAWTSPWWLLPWTTSIVPSRVHWFQTDLTGWESFSTTTFLAENENRAGRHADMLYRRGRDLSQFLWIGSWCRVSHCFWRSEIKSTELTHFRPKKHLAMVAVLHFFYHRWFHMQRSSDNVFHNWWKVKFFSNNEGKYSPPLWLLCMSD